jgi:hypothetical protein
MSERRFPFSKPLYSPCRSGGFVDVHRLGCLSEICIHISDTVDALDGRARAQHVENPRRLANAVGKTVRRPSAASCEFRP